MAGATRAQKCSPKWTGIEKDPNNKVGGCRNPVRDLWGPWNECRLSDALRALIGGACTMWAATRQFNLPAQEERHLRDDWLARRFASFRVRINSIKKPDAGALAELSKLAVEMRTSFIDNADQLQKIENQKFYVDYLAEDQRHLDFLSDGQGLTPKISK